MRRSRSPIQLKRERRSLTAYRALVRRAVELLSKAAHSIEFRASYTRTLKGIEVPANVFCVESADGLLSARFVLWNPYVYIQAEGLELPRGVQSISDDERKRRHLGALRWRIKIDAESDVLLLKKALDRLKSNAITGSRKQGTQR